MLSKPEYGWTHFQLGNETEYRLSYLTDVAYDWLTQAIHGLETMDVFSVHGFSEPGRMVCTVSYWSCYIISEDDGPAPTCEGVQHVHVNMIDFCKRLYHDIDSNFNGWVHWDDGSVECSAEESIDDDVDGAELDKQIADKTEEAFQNRERILREKLDKLKKLIEENEDYFDNGCFF